MENEPGAEENASGPKFSLLRGNACVLKPVSVRRNAEESVPESSRIDPELWRTRIVARMDPPHQLYSSHR